jgi:multidrug transporter EmrE-like cation transporter
MSDRGTAIPAPTIPLPAPPWLLNPYLHLGLNGFLITAAELLLKRGAIATASIPAPPWLSWLGITALGSSWVWGGIVFYILSFVVWLHVLRAVPLSIAFSIAAVVHALIPLGSWIFLHESISPARWLGIGLIMIGIWFIAQPMSRAEEAL